MGRGIRIGRIFGIAIHIDWSWVFIFFLVTWSLAVGVFPQWHSDWGPGLNWAIAVAASLLFFASVLIHELSHSLVAKAHGLPVRNITLFLFGGVSNIEREPSSPRTEFLIAVVGPIASIFLGIFFTFLGGLLAGVKMGITTDPVETISQLDPLSTLLLWLGPVNLIVGIFNLIPGFPLDGGRILRSILWGATSNLRRATRWAAGVGHLIAWFFIIAGIAMAFGAQVPIFGSGLINGLWLAFIGWFLNSAASSGYQQIVIQDLLEDVPVERIMRVEGPTVPPHLPVSYLVYKWIIGTDERAFPVIVGDRMVGLVCLDDVRKLPREEWGCTTVSDIMTRFDQLAFVSPQENASSALNKLEMRNLGMIPVVQEGRLVGLLRRRDIIRWLQLQSDFATS